MSTQISVLSLEGPSHYLLTVSICFEMIENTQNTTTHAQVYMFKITVQWDIYNIPFMKTVDFNMNHIVKLPSWYTFN